MLPMVGSAAAARGAAQLCEIRAGTASAASRCRSPTIATHPAPCRRSSATPTSAAPSSALIETAEGVENAEEIAAIEDVDILWIGHFDLSVSMGIAGQFDHPDFKAAVARVVRAAKKHNKSLGRLVPNVDAGAALFKEGFDFICYSGDVWLLQQAMREGVEGLRAQCKRGRRRAKK